VNAKYSFTDDQVAWAVGNSYSMAGTMRNLGIRLGGGNQNHLKKRIERLDLDTSHWTRRGHNKGKISPQRLSADEILIIIPQDSYRIRRSMLLRSLLEKGMEYRCRGCSNDGYWKDKELCLEINHINGNWYDNTFENLEFLCPNCHSQEPTSHTRKNVAALT
jgi:5-methylcytosine-specific restriction endonuclease McrA